MRVVGLGKARGFLRWKRRGRGEPRLTVSSPILLYNILPYNVNEFQITSIGSEMPKVDISRAEANILELDAQEMPTNNELPFSFLKRPDNKTTQLLASADCSRPMKGKNIWYKYEFKEAIFLLDITISTFGYGHMSDFEFQWTTSDGVTHSKVLTKHEDETYKISIKELVHSVRFKPPKRFFSQTEIGPIVLNGFPRDKLETFLDITANMTGYKETILAECQKAIDNAAKENEKVEKLELSVSNLNDQITSLQATIEQLNGEIGRLTEERNSLNANVDSIKQSIREQNTQLKKVEEEISVHEETRKQLRTELESNREELKRLKNDINMFPSEISEFVKQGAGNIKTYSWYAVVPLLLIVGVTGLLVFNAANLTTVFDENKDARILSIMVTRIPYVMIAMAIIAASYKLAAHFISEIMRINQQRLNLSKISIIATEVATASEDGLDIDDDQRAFLEL